MEMPPPLPLHRSPLASCVPRRAHPRNWAVLVEPETIPACRREMRLPQICCLLPSRETIFHHKLREKAKPGQGPLQMQEAVSKQV